MLSDLIVLLFPFNEKRYIELYEYWFGNREWNAPKVRFRIRCLFSVKKGQELTPIDQFVISIIG